ncbi:MAG: AraC family transcriptional regulator [Gammaproteobacteria bacterium]|nr:MAG: AraC family transcriptional regulator [Gammaproteobacteria bacterium]
MDAIPLTRTSILRPFTHYLRQMGAPVENGLCKAKLPVMSIDDPEHYVSTTAFWNFAGNMARREGIGNLGILVGEAYGANSMHPTFRQTLLACPTLYQALMQTCMALARESSLSYTTVAVIDADTSRFYHHTSFGLDHPSHYHMEWFALSAMVEIVRVFTGPDWQPAEIGLMSGHTPGRIIRARFPDTRFVNRQSSSHISIDTGLLSTPPFAEPVDDLMTTTSMDNNNPADDFSGALKQLLSAYLPEGTPPVGLIAELAGTSVRSLQRHLKLSGFSFRELLEQARYDTAIGMLANTDETISDIALRLGYPEPTHFARAFRRMAGVSPGQYRSLHS